MLKSIGNNPRVLVVGKATPLSELLVRKLLDKKCKTAYWSGNINFRYVTNLAYDKDFVPDYVVFLSAMLSEHNGILRNVSEKIILKRVEKLFQKYGCKVVFVFPYLFTEKGNHGTIKLFEKFFDRHEKHTAMLFFGNIPTAGGAGAAHRFYYGFKNTPSSHDGDESNSEPKISLGMKPSRSLLPGKFYPISEEDGAQIIIESLFSLKRYGTTTAFLGKVVSLKQTISVVGKTNRLRDIFLRPAKVIWKYPVKEFVFLSSKHKASKKPKSIYDVEQNAEKRLDLTTKFAFHKRGVLVAFLLTIFLFPVWSPNLCSFALSQIQKYFIKGDYNKVKTVSIISSPLFYSVEKISKIYNLPGIGGVNRLKQQMKTISEIQTLCFYILQKKINLLENSGKLVEKLVAGGTRESNYEEIKRDSLWIYERTGFLQSVLGGGEVPLNNAKFIGTNLAGEMDKYLGLIKLTEILPMVLGKDEPKTYLVLVQDPEIPTPGLGVTGEAYFIKFSGNSPLEITTVDPGVNTDGGKGVISPPNEFKKYIGDVWSLETYDLSYYFPESAKHAITLSRKQYGLTPDGVISISRAARDEMAGVYSGGNKNEQLVLYLVNALETKDVRIFLTDDSAEKIIEQLNFNGGIGKPRCAQSCIADFAGYFEMSGSADSNIVRDFEQRILLEEGILKSMMKINFNNSGNNNYDFRLGVLVPEEAGFSPVKVTRKGVGADVKPTLSGHEGFKTASVETVVGPGETGYVEFYWEKSFTGDLEQLKEYDLLLNRPVFKGNAEYDLKLSIPLENLLAYDPEFDLTGEGELRYNTVWSKERFFRIFLK